MNEPRADHRIQPLTTEILTLLVSTPDAGFDELLRTIQRRICETLDLDRCTIWQTSGETGGIDLTHVWHRHSPVELHPHYPARVNLPWISGRILAGGSVRFTRLTELPPEAAADAAALEAHGTRSNLTFPLLGDRRVIGAIAFATITREHPWTDGETDGLHIISQILSQAISRARADERLAQLRAEIQSSARASTLGELAAALAHEINQPLASILSNAQAARRFLGRPDADMAELRAILDDIIREDKRAADVIRSIRSMLGGPPPRSEVRPVHALIHEVLELNTRELAAARVRVDLSLATDQEPFALVTASAFRLLLQNLLANSIQAVETRGTDERAVTIRTTVEGDAIVITVRDNGPGIPPLQLERIFEPFHTTRGSGLGIGLAICRRIAEHNGGAITAANTGTGAEFRVILPVYDPVGAS